MEGLTRLVSESMARHGFDRPLDYRRLHWSRWFRCESHHSLLFVPSKPGVFALAEEIMGFSDAPVAADAFDRPPTRSEAESVWGRVADPLKPGNARHDPATNREEHDFGRAVKGANILPALAAEGIADGNDQVGPIRHMLAVTQFFEDDDMAFVLDRMLSRQNPMRARLMTGRYFVRFVVIEEQTQRRTICNALNQWMVTAAEKVTGIGSHFATSLELTPATEYVAPAKEAQQRMFVGPSEAHVEADAFVPPPERGETAPGISSGAPASHPSQTAPQLDSGAATNLHCPSPLPFGF